MKNKSVFISIWARHRQDIHTLRVFKVLGVSHQLVLLSKWICPNFLFSHYAKSFPNQFQQNEILWHPQGVAYFPSLFKIRIFWSNGLFFILSLSGWSSENYFQNSSISLKHSGLLYAFIPVFSAQPNWCHIDHPCLFVCPLLQDSPSSVIKYNCKFLFLLQNQPAK